MTEQEETNLQKFVEFCDSEFGKRVMKIEADFIRKELGRDAFGKILDVGCGIGAIEKYLADLDITGVDTSRVFLAEAGKRSNKRFMLGNATDLPFEDASFDVVISVATLEFIQNYLEVIQEINRVLKPNGRVVILMLNPNSEYVKGRRKVKSSYFNEIKHRSVYSIRREMLDYFELSNKKFFLGIKGGQIFDAESEKLSAFVVAVGYKRE